MRMVFGVLGLLVVVAIVGLVAKKQLSSVSVPPAAAATSTGVAMPTGAPKQQVEQFRQSVESALQQSRPVNDDTK